MLQVRLLVLLLSEAAARSQSSFTTSRLGHDAAASLANNDGLGVAKDGSDFKAVWAFNIHKEGVWGLYQSLLFVFSFFTSKAWVEKIDCERHGFKGFLF